MKTGMPRDRSFLSRISLMSVTSPTFTPLKSTGEPMPRPLTESLKKRTNCLSWLKIFTDPKSSIPATISTVAPTTNPPISFVFACLLIVLRAFSGRFRIIACRDALPGDRRPESSCFSLLTPGQEAANFGVITFRQEFFRVPGRSHGPGFRIEKNRVVTDGKDACQFVRDDHDRGPKAVTQFQDEFVEAACAYRVKSRRGFVEKEDIRIEGHCTGKAGTFAHPAADLGRVEFFKSCEPDKGQFQGNQLVYLRWTQSSIFGQRERHIFSQCHGAPQCPALVEDPKAPHDGIFPGGLRIPETYLIEEDLSLGRFFQTHEVPEKCALAASAPPHDYEDITAVYGETEIALNHKASIGHGEIAHFDASCRLIRLIFHR